MSFSILALALALGLFLGMVLLTEVGRSLGRRRLARDPDGARAGLSSVEGAVFALLGLLVAFTLSGAVSRFDARRQLLVQEVNAIGTAWLRIDVLPAEAQPPLRDLFRRYVDSRIATYRKLPDVKAAFQELARSTRLQDELWREAVAACRAAGPQPATMFLLPAINEMIDITTTRLVAAQSHPPGVIFVMLGALSLANALLAGFRMAEAKARSLLHVLGFPLVITVTVYVAINIEYPRLGLIRLDAVDQVLVDLRRSMGP
jgi:hypothetical protein